MAFKVVCVNAAESLGHLRFGQVYSVQETWDCPGCRLMRYSLEGVGGSGWHSNRFVPIDRTDLHNVMRYDSARRHIKGSTIK